jgi:hypothetical protein
MRLLCEARIGALDAAEKYYAVAGCLIAVLRLFLDLSNLILATASAVIRSEMIPLGEGSIDIRSLRLVERRRE